jgi:hypothetical protein
MIFYFHSKNQQIRSKLEFSPDIPALPRQDYIGQRRCRARQILLSFHAALPRHKQAQTRRCRAVTSVQEL